MTYSYKTEPFRHQIEALKQSAMKRNFAYFMEMGCVDEDTEFLTQRGWVKFGDFDLDTWERPLLVAQAYPEDGPGIRDWSYEFVEPVSFIKKPAHDWITCLVGYRVGSNAPAKRYMFTEDHTLPIMYTYTTRQGGRAYYKKVPMMEASLKYLYQVVKEDPKRKPWYPTKQARTGFRIINKANAGLRGFNSDYFRPDPELYSLNEWELRLMVAVMADGTFPNKTNNKCDIQVIKRRKAERLQMLLARAGITYTLETKPRRIIKEKKEDMSTLYTFHFIAPIRTKVYGPAWYTLDQSRLKIIASEVSYWDGWQGDDRIEFYSVMKDSADFIQYAFFACGWQAGISYRVKDRMYTVRAWMKRGYDQSIIHETDKPTMHYESTDDYGGLRLPTFAKETKERMSYCFRVPSGYLVLRRDDEIFISGNSGKTKVMIDNIGVLHNKGLISGALILAPKGVYRNWSEKEIPAHLPDSIDREILVWDAASSAGKKDRIKRQIKDWDGKKLQLLVFNIESLISEKGRELIDDFIKRHSGNVFALVDESTCIKNHKAKRTKAAIALGEKCKVRRIATGSPITNSPLDLYSQCAFLDKRLLGYGSYYAFKNTYADIERIQNRQGVSYDKIIRYKNLDILSDKLNNFSYRITKKECLDLPEKIYVTRDVELTPEQKRVYKEMYESQFAVIKDKEEFKEMSTSVILTKFLRLHQVLCGTFVSDDGKVINLPENRTEALKEVLYETSGKVIIWANYLENIRSIKDMLTTEFGEDSFVTYFGETSSEDRTKAIELFQDPASPVRFFLGNVQTAGRGITLTEANTVVYYSNNFSLEFRQQSEDRAHRVGQKNNVTYIDLVVRGSLDEKIIKSLIEKKNIAQEVLKDEVENWITLRPCS